MAWQSSTPRLPGYVAGIIRGQRQVKILNRFAAKVAARELAQATAVDWTKYRNDIALFALDMFGVVLWQRQAEIAHAVETHNRVAVKSGHKVGKDLADDTQIPTPSGWRPHGDLRPGDEVFDEAGKPCRVVRVFPQTARPMMRVTFEDGSHVDADELHEWLVRSRSCKKPVIKETREIFSAIRGPDGGPNFTIDLPWAGRCMAVTSVEPLPGLHSAQCIEVDSASHLYLCGESMVPTHNSRLVAIVAWWWACTRTHGHVYMTSASWAQVVETLWPEVRLAWTLANERGHRLSPSPPPIDGGTGVRWPDGRKIIAFSTNTPERAAGFSGPEMLFELDECSGISREIYEAIMGNTMGGAKEFLTGNPTVASGILYDAFTDKAHLYSTHTISSQETPNATSDDQSTWIPGLADRAKIDELLGEYGSDSPFADIRIHGNFPRQGQNSVIGIAEVEAAQLRHRIAPEPGWRRLRVGVDVARYGDDDSVVYGVRGSRSLEPLVAHGQDTQEIASLVFRYVQDELARSSGHEQERPIVRVDEIGVGAGVVDRLRAMLSEHAARHSGQALFILVGINVSRTAMDPERYALARDEAWFAARDWLRAGGTLPTDGRLAGELAGILYKLDPRGRYQVESKDETKRRLKRSPDRADALCLAVYGQEHSEPVVVSAGPRTTPQYSAPRAAGLGRGKNIWGR